MSENPTRDICPESKYGDTHELRPVRDGVTPQGEPAYVQRCRTCGKTREELVGA